MQQQKRFLALDVFRGMTICFMIIVNTSPDGDHTFAPLLHAKWHGFTPTDLVFPSFLFAVGNAMSFVMPKWETASTSFVLTKIFKRTLLIFLLGYLMYWFPFVRWDDKTGDYFLLPFDKTRVFGVLQRIALAYCFASLIIYYGKVRAAFVAGAVILLGYWLVCMLAGAPGDPYSLSGYFGTAVDKAVLGTAHMYKGEGVAFDPEGLASLLPAVVQVILGYMVSNYILLKGKTYEMIAGLFVIGCIFIFAGFCWDMVFPINKKIWTSSFVIYTTGLAILVLCVLMYIIEMRQVRGAWSRCFDVFGKNALFIFMVSGILPRIYGLIRITDGVDGKGQVIHKGLSQWMYDHVFAPAFGFMNGSLLYAVFNILLMWVLCYWLDRKKIYIKV